MTGPLTTIEPYPPARPLPAGYDRHHPDLPSERAAVAGLVAGVAWADLAWPALVEELQVQPDVVGQRPQARADDGRGQDQVHLVDQANAVRRWTLR